MVQLFSGTALTIALKAIGIVMLKRKIQSIQKIIQSSPKRRHGSDKIREETHIFIRQYLSANTPHKAFPNAIQNTKTKESKNHSFHEKLTKNPIKERIIIEINNNDMISIKGNSQSLSG